MAAPAGNQNAVGNSGGKSLNDRKLAAKVRNLTLQRIADLLETPVVKMSHDDYEFYKAVVVKLAGSVLPKLAEVTGEDGSPVVIQIAKEIADKNQINDPNPSPSSNSEGQPQVQSG